MSVRKFFCTAVPMFSLTIGLAALTGCHKDDDGHWKMGMEKKEGMSDMHMSKDEMMKKGDEKIMMGKEMKDKGMQMNDSKMQMDGQNMMDKGKMMKEKAMGM